MPTITIHNQTLCYLGDASMLLCPMTAFFCSQHTPADTEAIVNRWVTSLDTADTCVVCGTMTLIERTVLRMLVDRGIPVALALPHYIDEAAALQMLSSWTRKAYDEGRLVFISPVEDPSVKAATAKTAAQRNLMMIALAENIVVGYMTENGNLMRQLLGHTNVTVLSDVTRNAAQPETDAQRAAYNATQMGWAIYRQLKGERLLTSVEMRGLLLKYLKLEGVARPSLLHSLILFQVLNRYKGLTDFDFTTFFRMWGPDNLRPEDWQRQKYDGHWLPSLSERVLARLFCALPSKFRKCINEHERFDAPLVHQLLYQAIERSRKPSKVLCSRALRLAYYEHDSAAIERWRAQVVQTAPQASRGRH